MAIKAEIKRKAVEEYLKVKSLRKVAYKYNIHYLTLWKWLKGNSKEKFPFKIPKKIVKEVYMFKEKYPHASLNECRRFFLRKKIKLSLKTIWKIWKKAGFEKNREKDSLYSPLCEKDRDNSAILDEVKKLLNKGEIEKASSLVNSMLGYPLDPLIKEIPDRFLSTRRKLDKIYLSFGTLPLPILIKKVRRLRKKLLKENYLYSYIKASLMELMYLSWIPDPEEQVKVIRELEKYIQHVRDISIKFLFNFHHGISNAYLLKIKEAQKFYNICKKIACSQNKSQYWNIMGSFASFLGDYKSSFKFYKKAYLTEKIKEYKDYWKIRMGSCLAHTGDYKNALKMIKIYNSKPLLFDIHSAIIEANCKFGTGEFEKCIKILNETIEKAKREQLKNYVSVIYLMMASINKFLGKDEEAKKFIIKSIFFSKKYNMKRDYIINSLIKGDYNIWKEIMKDKEIKKFPFIKIIIYLKNSGKQPYLIFHALNFANKKGILTDFYKFLPFFPSGLKKLRGKVNLNKTFLNFPIFEPESINFEITFLKNFSIKVNRKLVNTIFYPQEKSFIIFLSINYSKREIPIEEIYKNFWPNKENKYKNLKYLIYNLRKKLNISPNFIKIQSSKEGKFLLINKIIFNTDYEKFENYLFKAKTFQKLGEFDEAIKEYQNALALVEKIPMEKCYNRFSEDFRTEITLRIRDSLKELLNLLIYRNKISQARELIKKFSKILHFLEMDEEFHTFLNIR